MNCYLGIHDLKSAQKEVKGTCYLWGKKGIQAGTFRLEATGGGQRKKRKKPVCEHEAKARINIALQTEG